MKISSENNTYLLEQIFAELAVGVDFVNNEMSPPPSLLKAKSLLGEFIYKLKSGNDIDSLDKDDILWIFALKRNRIQYHYDTYYGIYDGEPSKYTLFMILNPIVDKLGGWKNVITELRTNKQLYSIMSGKDEAPLHHWLFHGIESYLKFLPVATIDKHSNATQWRSWVTTEDNKYESTLQEVTK